MPTVAGPSASRPDAPPRRELPATLPPPREPWPGRSAGRRRLAAAGGALALLIAAAVALVLAGSGEAPPATGAARVVPAGALAYVSLSTDPSRPAFARARALVSRFPDWPLLRAAALRRLGALVGAPGPNDFASASRPWLGKEAAVALLPGPGGSAQPLAVLDVAHRGQAQAFVNASGATPAGSYAGVRLVRAASGSELGFVGHYLIAGPDPAMRAAIDAARGRTRALARSSGYERAVSGQPADRVLDAYLPAGWIRHLLAPRTGVAGAVGALLDRPGLEGAELSLSATSTGARVLVHSVLAAGSAPPRSFTPTLDSVLPAGSALMLDVAGLHRAGPGMLRAMATAGIAANVGPLLSRVGTALTGQGVNVRKVLSLFDGETAVALAPGATPALLIVARVRSQAAAQSELAALQGPMTSIFSPSGSDGGQVPELADRVAGATTIHEVGLGPGLQVDYAVFNRLVAISTSMQAIEAVVQRSRSLAATAAYRAVLAAPGKPVSSLVFGEFTQLLRLGEQTGLTGGAFTHELLPDLSKLRAIGLSSTGAERDTTTELTFEIP